VSFGKLLVFCVAAFFSSMQLQGAPVDTTYDDQSGNAAQANTQRTPYTIKPVAPVQLGQPGRNGTLPAAPGSSAVYNTFRSYFTKTIAEDNFKGLHFNETLWKSSHTLAFPVNAPFSYTPPVNGQMNVYFIDRQASFNQALGFIKTADYPTSSDTDKHPLKNINHGNNYIFPYIQEANSHSPDFGGTASPLKNRFAQDITNPKNFDPTKERPLLMSDLVSFPVFKNQTLDLFLISQVNTYDHKGDFTSPDNKPTQQAQPSFNFDTNVWTTDITHNLTSTAGEHLSNQFQHFQFYLVPELDAFPEFQNMFNLLVMVEDKGVYNGTDYDFNDLFFLISLPQEKVPEPKIYLIIGILLTVAFIIGRREKRVDVNK